ncbi:hypothetical protein [Aestuariimicrobium sp. Y1814]|uniref:hypothetical protein n=1 Tax=Aestuariimicrobium sp. Y1814 TaxID=3418742 RepID=UPI003DA6D00A
MTERKHRRTIDASPLIWGLIFLAVATLGTLRGLGYPIDWQLVGIITPVALIALGITGLALNRFQTREDSP